MHMSDALVIPAVAGTMYVCSSISAGYSIKRVKMENNDKRIPVMGVMGAFVFATQMINFTIPGTGASGHLCGGLLLSALLGPFAGFLTMIGVMLIQCLIFADGGILALGCNIWNMAFYGCFLGALLIWRPIMKNGASRRKIITASILGCVITLQIGAFSVVLETMASGITELPFISFILVMQPIHILIGLVEGIITAAVLCFIYEARPELLWGIGAIGEQKTGKLTFKRTLIILSVVAILVAGGLSIVASNNPDGLEWSIEKVTGSNEVKAVGDIYDDAANLQGTTAILQDYALQDSDSAVGTSFSGIIGGLAVAGFCIGGCYLFKFIRKKR